MGFLGEFVYLFVEFEQQGKEKADYGSALLTTLAKDLKIKYGKGFSKSTIYLCRLFYIKYQKFQTVSGKLSWSHYAELLTVYPRSIPLLRFGLRDLLCGTGMTKRIQRATLINL